MKVLVLKDLNYAHDGIHNVLLKAGTVADVVDGVVPGLKKEGYVKDAPAEKPGAQKEPAAPAPSPSPAPSGKLEIVDVGDGKFNVVGADGKPVNDQPVGRKAAEKLLADAEKKTDEAK